MLTSNIRMGRNMTSVISTVAWLLWTSLIILEIKLKKKQPVSVKITDKCFVHARDYGEMVRLVRADRKAAVSRLTTVYNHGEQKSTSKCTNCQSLRWMDSNTKLKLKWVQVRRNQ